MLPIEEYSLPMQQLCNHIHLEMSTDGLKEKKIESTHWSQHFLGE